MYHDRSTTFLPLTYTLVTTKENLWSQTTENPPPLFSSTRSKISRPTHHHVLFHPGKQQQQQQPTTTAAQKSSRPIRPIPLFKIQNHPHHRRSRRHRSLLRLPVRPPKLPSPLPRHFHLLRPPSHLTPSRRRSFPAANFLPLRRDQFTTTPIRLRGDFANIWKSGRLGEQRRCSRPISA